MQHLGLPLVGVSLQAHGPPSCGVLTLPGCPSACLGLLWFKQQPCWEQSSGRGGQGDGWLHWGLATSLSPLWRAGPTAGLRAFSTTGGFFFCGNLWKYVGCLSPSASWG